LFGRDGSRLGLRRGRYLPGVAPGLRDDSLALGVRALQER